MMRWIPACLEAATHDRPIRAVRVADQALLLVRHGDMLIACERACPHDYADLRAGRCVDGRLHCPRHRASFDLVTGAVSHGWDIRPLRLFPTRINDGWVEIQL